MKTKEQILESLKYAEQNHLNFATDLREGKHLDIPSEQLRNMLQSKLKEIETLKWVLE